MKKSLWIILLLTFVLISKEAYAVMDIMASVESGLKGYEETKNKILEYEKLVQNELTKVRQGFDSLENCFGNPTKCGGAFTDITKAVEGVSAIGDKLSEDGLVEQSPEKLADSIRKDGTYKKGQGKDIKKRNEMETKNNATVIDNIARLFAKGMVTHQSILLEDKDVYEAKFEKGDLDEVIYAQSKISLNSKRRIAHILELRSYLHSAEALKELTQYNREPDEE